MKSICVAVSRLVCDEMAVMFLETCSQEAMDHEIQDTDPHIVYRVNLRVTLIYHPKCNFS